MTTAFSLLPVLLHLGTAPLRMAGAAVAGFLFRQVIHEATKVLPKAPAPTPVPAPLKVPAVQPQLEVGNMNVQEIFKKFLSSLGKGLAATLVAAALAALGAIQTVPFQGADPGSSYVWGLVIGNICHALIALLVKWQQEHQAAQAAKAVPKA